MLLLEDPGGEVLQRLRVLGVDDLVFFLGAVSERDLRPRGDVLDNLVFAFVLWHVRQVSLSRFGGSGLSAARAGTLRMAAVNASAANFNARCADGQSCMTT